jgi:hypothetical protein
MGGRTTKAAGGDGNLVAFKAVVADAKGSYMGWFAQRLALGTGSDLHTHSPISGLTESCIRHVNAGFNCPSIPDIGEKNPTFVSIVDSNERLALSS